MVYVATNDSRVVALDAASGAVSWERRVGAARPRAAPAVDGESLFVALRDQYLIALDMEIGEDRWSFLASGGPLLWSPVVVDGAVYVLSADEGLVTSVDAVTGEKLWEGASDKTWSIAAVTWTGDRMLVAAADRIFYFDVRTGKNYFTYDIAGGNAVGAPAVLDRMAYVAVDFGVILALGRDSKAPVWERPMRHVWGQMWLWGMAPRPPVPSGLLWVYNVREPIMAPLAVTDEALYFGTSSGQIVALDLETKEPRWTYQGAGAVRGAPAVAGDIMYIGAGGRLYAISTETGEVQWSFQAAKEISGDVVITSDAVYIVDKGANIYAIE